MPHYFFDIKDGHKARGPARVRLQKWRRCAKVLAIGVSLDTPKDDPERRVAIINDQGREIGTVPVYSKPSLEHPASK